MRAIHKRLTSEDKLARRYRCQRARRSFIRAQKKYNRRKMRRILRRETEC